jgi:hypothetical protein
LSGGAASAVHRPDSPAAGRFRRSLASFSSGDHHNRVRIVIPEEYDMKKRLIRTFAMIVTAAFVSVAGSGVALAGGPGGSGSSSTTSAAAEVQALRDGLAARADHGDVPGTQATLARLDPLLTDLAQGKRYTIQADARDTAATARQENTEARKGVDELATRVEARQGLPSVTDLLNALVQRLLLSLSSLVNDLLGGPHIIPAG